MGIKRRSVSGTGANRAVFIVGPTAAGKTSLAVKVARRLHGEIISCDSMQVYKGMAVASQSPGAAAKKAVRHHLVEVLDPHCEYNAASFRRRATAIIASLERRGKPPVIVGGSGLYIKALIDGLFPSPKPDERFRRSMYRFTATHGSKALHDRLAGIDAQAARSIHPNDTRRIIRALEIHHTAGKTKTDLKKKTRGIAGTHKVMLFGITRPREDLYNRIDRRCDAMVEDGIVEEVEKLRRKKLSRTARGMLGFKEVMGYVSGQYDSEAMKELLKKNTRRFAKRQLTWFRADKRIRWFDASAVSEEKIVKEIAKAVR